MTVRIICDREVTHEIVRHRLCGYSQESTRYCNYRGGVTFVIPPWVDIKPGEYSQKPGTQWRGDHGSELWFLAMLDAELRYCGLLDDGWTPQRARSVLPSSTKTEIVWTANFREWRHIFRLRCSKAAHPQMQEVMTPLLEEVKYSMPVIFKDI